MDFDLSADQKMLADSAASFAKKESPITRMRALRDDPVGWTQSTWKLMGELGWLGILVPEAAGGLGSSFVELALVIEELGRTLVPEPLIASCALATTAIVDLGSAAQQEELLGPLAAGDASYALAYAERGSRYDLSRVETRAERRGGDYAITGEKVFVLDGHAADKLLVSARTSGGVGDANGISLFVVDPKASGVSVRAIKTMDGQRAANVRFQGALISSAARLGEEGRAADALEHAIDRGAAAACAEGVGILRASLETTRDYLCTREQFGVKIGSFQALQHRCVDMFIENQLAKSTSVLAMLSVDVSDAHARRSAISAAKAQLSASGRFVTQQATQLLGGIAITDEHDIGLFFKRMTVLNALFGDEEFHLARFAAQPSFTEGV